MDENARWELALRQKQEADRQADKKAEKELVKSSIARLKQIIDKQKGKKDKKKHKDKKIKKESKRAKKSKKNHDEKQCLLD